MSIRNDILLKIRAALGGAPLGVDDMSNRNKILADTVQAAGGTVRNASNLNMLLEDLYNALSADSGTITITGSGFGVGPVIYLFDDFTDPVYDGLVEGDYIPTINPTVGVGNPNALYETHKTLLPTAITKLDTFGNRRGSMLLTDCNRAMTGPRGCNDTTDKLTSFYINSKYKFDSNIFEPTGADKFVRIWADNDKILQPIISYETGHIRDVTFSGTTGFCIPNMWFVGEQFFDGISGLIESRYFNVQTASDYNPNAILQDPNNSGARIQVLGMDDGDGSLAGITGWQSDIYISDTRKRIELCSAPDPKRALHREIQLPTSWSDSSITYTRDAQAIDPLNHWEIVTDADDATVLSVRKIGDPVAVEQYIRRPIHSELVGRILGLKAQLPVAGDFNFSFDMAGIDADVDTVTFTFDGFNSKIIYNNIAKTWFIRIGNGTEFSDVAATATIIDGLEHNARCELRGSNFKIFIDGDATPEVDVTGTMGTFQLLNLGGLARKNANENPAFWMWNIKLEDLTTESNGVHFKLDEQVGGINQANYRIYDYIRLEYTTLISTLGGWAYTPGEGY